MMGKLSVSGRVIRGGDRTDNGKLSRSGRVIGGGDGTDYRSGLRHFGSGRVIRGEEKVCGGSGF